MIVIDIINEILYNPVRERIEHDKIVYVFVLIAFFLNSVLYPIILSIAILRNHDIYFNVYLGIVSFIISCVWLCIHDEESTTNFLVYYAIHINISLYMFILWSFIISGIYIYVKLFKKIYRNY